MEFGWINLIGAIFVIIMLIPNIVFALKTPAQENDSRNKVMEIVEQVGRYACIVLMWLPLFVWKFGFRSVVAFILYIGVNSLLLLAYLLIWGVYFKKRARKVAILLAVIPACIFLLSGILLWHWSLVAAAVIFGVGHMYITVKNHG